MVVQPALGGIGKLSKIAVIGAGAFGVATAVELSKSGHKVTLFEKNQFILQEATANSQNRLHLGLHYPRDLETAIQSRIGFKKFIARYPSSVRTNFPNYYAIASNGSRVSPEFFLDFAEKAGIRLNTARDHKPFGLKPEMIDGIWECDEGVIDITTFRGQLEREIREFEVTLLVNIEIREILKKNGFWTLKDLQGQLYKHFEFVIRATYGNDALVSDYVELNTKYDFHRTLILEVSSQSKPAGVTIIDGDFLTLLPKGFTDRFLIYAPSISVLDRSSGFSPKWNQFDLTDRISSSEESLINRTRNWLPNLKIGSVAERLVTIRSLQPNVTATDKRVSEIRWLNNEVVEIWSGKIDHCVEISEKITNQINARQMIF